MKSPIYSNENFYVVDICTQTELFQIAFEVRNTIPKYIQLICGDNHFHSVFILFNTNTNEYLGAISLHLNKLLTLYLDGYFFYGEIIDMLKAIIKREKELLNIMYFRVDSTQISPDLFSCFSEIGFRNSRSLPNILEYTNFR